MSFSAANWASISEAKSSGVTTLRTLSPPLHSPIRLFGIMAARQCPGLRRYVTIENSETFAMMRPRGGADSRLLLYDVNGQSFGINRTSRGAHARPQTPTTVAGKARQLRLECFVSC